MLQQLEKIVERMKKWLTKEGAMTGDLNVQRQQKWQDPKTELKHLNEQTGKA